MLVCICVLVCVGELTFCLMSKFGGALLARIEKISASIIIEDSTFVNNKARKSGQAILIDGSISSRIHKVNITSNSEEKADHLHARGTYIKVENVNIKLHHLKTIRNTMIMNVITLKDMYMTKQFTGVTYTCPLHFNALNDKEITIEWKNSKPDLIRTSFFHGVCETA